MSICPQATSANLSGFRSKLQFTDNMLEINHVRNQIPRDHLRVFFVWSKATNHLINATTCTNSSCYRCGINADMVGMHHFLRKR